MNGLNMFLNWVFQILFYNILITGLNMFLDNDDTNLETQLKGKDDEHSLILLREK